MGDRECVVVEVNVMTLIRCASHGVKPGGHYPPRHDRRCPGVGNTARAPARRDPINATTQACDALPIIIEG